MNRAEGMLAQVALSLMIVLATLFYPYSSFAAPEITVRVGHAGSPGSKDDHDVHLFAQLVKTKSGGRIEVKEYPGGLLGSFPAQLDGALAGTHEIVYQVTAILNLIKEERYWDLPFLFKDRDAVTRLESAPLREQIEQIYLNKGLVFLGYFENGFRHVSNNRGPINRPEDCKGLKHRVAEGATKILLWKSFGANPTPIPHSELYQALKQGVVDSQDNPLPNIYGSKWYEVQKYISLIGYVYNPQIMAAGKKFWDRQPAWAQAVLKESARTAALVSRYKGIYEEVEVKALMENKGIKFNTISAEDRKLWVKAAEPVYEAMSQDIGKDLLQKIRSVVGEE
jgi:tripartite ATP-independent transporter DctP family solute receptor